MALMVGEVTAKFQGSGHLGTTHPSRPQFTTIARRGQKVHIFDTLRHIASDCELEYRIMASEGSAAAKAQAALDNVTNKVAEVTVGDAAAPEGPSKSALKKAEKQAKMAAEKAAKAAKQALSAGPSKKTDDIIGITTTKEEDFSSWYQEVVLKSEMIEYYQEIAGFFILRPRSMFIWNVIKKWFTEEIEKLDVEEASFPLFLSQKAIEREKAHVEGFAPELAWVTKA